MSAHLLCELRAIAADLRAAVESSRSYRTVPGEELLGYSLRQADRLSALRGTVVAAISALDRAAVEEAKRAAALPYVTEGDDADHP